MPKELLLRHDLFARIKERDTAIVQLEENIGALHKQLVSTQNDYNELKAHEQNITKYIQENNYLKQEICKNKDLSKEAVWLPKNQFDKLQSENRAKLL